MSLNIELLETVYLVSSMLLEVPNLVAIKENHEISKRFRSLIYQYE